MNRKETLAEAEKIVCGEREGQYGSPEDSHKRIAEFWSVYLGISIEAKQVADMMILLKMARCAEGKYKADNYIDICGYAACANEIESSEGAVKPKFELEDYEGRYVMHCDTHDKACTFCHFLNVNNRCWGNGTPYIRDTGWYAEGNGCDICYGFNEGTADGIQEYKANGYTILEFDDYDWSDYDDRN